VSIATGAARPTAFPWSAVIGQERLKLALLLCAIDPSIGGVLVRGPRGVAKTTLARAFAELLPGRFVELPLHDQARRYLKSGPPWLERVMPFWAAGLLDRTVLVVLPMLTLLLPFFGLVVPVMARHHRGRIARSYAELRACDQQRDGLTLHDLDQRIARMRELDHEVTRLNLPTLYLGEMYNLKIHIDMVLRRLEERRTALVAGPASRSAGA